MMRSNTADLSIPTLDGSEVPAYDAAVIGLAGKIEEFVEQYGLLTSAGNRALEVEGRVGVIRDAATQDRLRLPVDAELLLEPPNSLFGYRFETGVTEDQFRRIEGMIQNILGLTGSGSSDVSAVAGQRMSPKNSERHSIVSHTATMDYLVDINESYFVKRKISRSDGEGFSPRTTRISYPMIEANGALVQSSTPSEAIWKDRLSVLNFFTGRDKEDAADLIGTTNLLDIRIAINVEYSVPSLVAVPSCLLYSAHSVRNTPTFVLSSEGPYKFWVVCNGSVLRRLRGRYRVDMTHVVELPGSSDNIRSSNSKEVFEVEVEINPVVLLREVEKKMKGRPHALYRILQDFMGILRDICYFVSATAPATLTSSVTTAHCKPVLESTVKPGPKRVALLANLAECGHEKKAVNALVTYMSPVVPLIGDYLYRAVAKERELCGAPPLTEQERKVDFNEKADATGVHLGKER